MIICSPLLENKMRRSRNELVSFCVLGLIHFIRDVSSLKCYTCDNEHSNIHCVGDMHLYECEEGLDTCQTIVAYSDVIEKLSIIKTCTKNSSCNLQREEKQMTKDLKVTCDITQNNWICTNCCHDDACNINVGHSLHGGFVNVYSMIYILCLNIYYNLS